MSKTIRNFSLVDYYFELLRNLNSDSKIELISKLTQSLKKGEKEHETSLESLYGAYKSDETAEDIISQMRSSRTFNRNTVSFLID